MSWTEHELSIGSGVTVGSARLVWVWENHYYFNIQAVTFTSPGAGHSAQWVFEHTDG